MISKDFSLPVNALGYPYNPDNISGLNNQKQALFGLFLKACREGPRRVVLPYFVSHDTAAYKSTPIQFDQVWQPRPLRDFAARHGIEIVDISPSGDKDAYGYYFWYAADYIPHLALMSGLAPDSFICEFFRSLVPNIQGSDLLHRVTDIAFVRRGVRVVAHLRIENEWTWHAEHQLRPKVGEAEDSAPSFKNVIAKIYNTLPDNPSIYVVCDEAGLPLAKDEIRGIVKREFDIDLFWKSDFMSDEDLSKLSVLDESIFNFEMAVAAELFIGHSRSTFSNMVALEKYARTGQPVKDHYVYNVIGPQLALRRDNGAFLSPTLAAAADPWNADSDFHLAQIFHLWSDINTRATPDVSGTRADDRARALNHYVAWAGSGAAKPDEIFISLYRAAQIKSDLSHPAAEVIDAYLRASEARPCRVEALHGASRYCRFNGRSQEGYEIAKRALVKDAVQYGEAPNGLFVEPWIYEYGLVDEFAVNAYWAGAYEDCLVACEHILRERKCPEAERSRIEANAAAARQQLGVGTVAMSFNAKLGHWQQEEMFCSLYAAAQLKEQQGLPEQAVIDAYLEASGAMPTRAEALHGASRFCRTKGRFEEGFQLARQGLAIARPPNGTSVEPWIYDYGLVDELAVNGYGCGHYRESLDASITLLACTAFPPDHRERIAAIARGALEKLPHSPDLGRLGIEEGFIEQHALVAPRHLRSQVVGAPRVLVAIFAKQQEASLPLYLECIEALDYPKSSIVLYIRTNNNTDRTESVLREWVARVGHLYAGVEFVAENLDESDATRFRVLGQVRNVSLTRALQLECEFYFAADVDNFIRPCTLRELVALNLPIVAPFLRSIAPEEYFSNYFADVDPNGYYRSCDQYHWVLNRWVRGVIELPLVHRTCLVRADVLKDVSYEDATMRHNFIVFSDGARRAGITQYVDNRQVYGYIVLGADNEVERARTLLEADIRMLATPAEPTGSKR